ncbi:MAG: DUF5615 family PIN-like protein [Acidobacteriota bacterium]
MASFLADENFPYPVVEELRRLGHDVQTLAELGKADLGVDDATVLSLAHEQKRAVLTLNRKDFLRLHRTSQVHSGLVVCSLDIDFVGQAGRISEAVSPHVQDAGWLLRIRRPG